MIPPNEHAVDPRLITEEKERLSWYPYFQRDANHTKDGVLLSNWIEYYCGRNFKMIEPFAKDCLRPAGYNLRVGANYAVGGGSFALHYGESFTI